MSDTPIEPGLPPSLRLLKVLVIVLMITMIVGVITVVGLLVTRMPNASDLAPALPATLQMPAGASAQTLAARPRRANSMATHPPMEFPARCGLSSLCSSR